jgi:hypothetical protein
MYRIGNGSGRDPDDFQGQYRRTAVSGGSLMDERVRGILEKEFKMTMGCTDPGAVAYAASKAASLLDGELKSIDVVLSKNIYKNAVFVGIPVIKKPVSNMRRCWVQWYANQS